MKFILEYFFILLILCFSTGCNRSKHNTSLKTNFIFGAFVDSKFIIYHDSSIIYSINDGRNFKLIKFKSGAWEQLSSKETKDYFNPFIAKGKVSALFDSIGNAEFEPNTDILNFFLSLTNKTVDRLYSSKTGNFVVATLVHDNGIYLLDLKKRNYRLLGIVNNSFNSVIFSKDEKFLILSYDSRLIYCSLTKNQRTELAENVSSPKLNPSIYKNELYFVMNNNSEFYQIYKIRLTVPYPKPKLVKKVNHDLRLPKVHGNYLYYIIIIKSEYLLGRENLLTHSEEFLTNRGVIYDYDFFLNNNLVLAYSDVVTPLNIFIYNFKTHRKKNISGNTLNLNIKYTFLEGGKSINTSMRALSPAYMFEPKNSLVNKGIILFFHPGLHNDFSPRWNCILMNLSSNGYTIIAPNYPMSCGYGKNYQNQPMKKAVDDMENWVTYIKKRFSSQPLYLVSFSSGNVIMESLLRGSNYGVKAAVSIFGIPGDRFPIFSTPILYILGRNDPIVNHKERVNMLKKSINMGNNANVLSFNNEGHWFRKASNMKHAVNSIISFLSNQ